MPEPHRRRAADVGRGLVALLATVALVVGIPVALTVGIGSPLPDRWPTPAAAARAAGSGNVSDTVVINLLAVACWLLWFELTVMLVVEALAYRRGRRAGRIPLAGGVQRGASGMVSRIALLGSLTARRRRADVPELPADLANVHRAAAWVPTLPDPPEGTPPATTTPAATRTSAPLATYEVQHRDSLWGIAERHLRDPFRWQEIFRLNEGRVQPDGGRLTDPDILRVGWHIDLPADATGLDPRSVPDDPTSVDHEATPTEARPATPVTVVSWSGDPAHD